MLAKDLTFAPTVPTWLKGPAEEVERSMAKPVSSLEPSIQVRLTWEAEAAVATKPEGAIGTVVLARVEALATFEKADFPAELSASTR